MQLHEIKSRHQKKNKKRIGRGGKRGTYSGRGQKGQKARAGRKIRPAERDILQRFPKLRGIKHRPVSLKPRILNLSDLERKFESGAITPVLLLEKKIIKKITEPVKVLGKGELKKVFNVTSIKVSKSAKSKIETAGGSVK